jgi:hypothetical protein
MVSIQLAQPDNAVVEIKFDDALWQRIELDGPSSLSRHRQLVKRLVDVRAIDGARSRRHDDFRRHNTSDSRHGTESS